MWFDLLVWLTLSLTDTIQSAAWSSVNKSTIGWSSANECPNDWIFAEKWFRWRQVNRGGRWRIKNRRGQMLSSASLEQFLQSFDFISILRCFYFLVPQNVWSNFIDLDQTLKTVPKRLGNCLVLLELSFLLECIFKIAQVHLKFTQTRICFILLK